MNSRIIFIDNRDGSFRIENCPDIVELDPGLAVVILLSSIGFLCYLWSLWPVGSKKLNEEDNPLEQRLRAAGYNLDTLDIDREFLCPIGFRVMQDPVQITYADHLSPSSDSFERSVIESLDKCPLTRRDIAGLIGNQQLKKRIEAWVGELENENKVKLPISSLFYPASKKEEKSSASTFSCNIL